MWMLLRNGDVYSSLFLFFCFCTNFNLVFFSTALSFHFYFFLVNRICYMHFLGLNKFKVRI